MAVLNMLIETLSLGSIYVLIYGSYDGDGALADELTQIPFSGFPFHSED